MSRSNDKLGVPDPWSELAAHPGLILVRAPIAEPGRYYDAHKCIVIRKGMLLEQERRYLWHELVHADRHDQECSGWLSQSQERSVDREAAKRAMPYLVLERVMGDAVTWADLVDQMKVPEQWVRFRLDICPPGERSTLKAISSRVHCWSSS